MEISPREVRLYVTRTGHVPFSEWLHALKDVRGRAVIRARINRLRLGNFGDCRSVGHGIFELRIPFGPGYRVYFGQDGETVILLCGGHKGSQARDIRTAHAYWADYRSRDDAEE